MPDNADENQGIVLFGADGTKYVIPMSVVSTYEVPQDLDLPDPATAGASPDITPIQAYQAPITPDSETSFLFFGGR
jgi:hypothetical protein